jgi:hypothetical protein
MATSTRGAAFLLIGALLAPLSGQSPSAQAAPAPAADVPAGSWSQVVRQVLESAPSATAAEASAAQKAQQMMRCFRLEDEHYCLGLGFVDEKPTVDEIVATAAEPAARPAATDGGPTGALSAADFVAERADLNEEDRLNAELAEMRAAWNGRQKAMMLRTAEAPATLREPPAALRIMGRYGTSQERGYWCGPAAFQSIDWADDQQRDTQASWAKDLGTTTSGTAISAMVQQTNLKTKWDNNAGTYIVQNVGHWTWQKFFTIHQTHLGDGTAAPVIEHTQLLKRYFPYLAFDHSGHFQVGRGYSKPDGTITIFEVFNERRFNSRGNVTHGSRDIPASMLFNATLANSFKNIGL